MSLKEYDRKRNFQATAEPKGQRASRAGHRFVVQKHAASRLHYDFRLEVGGTLKSWAVPKGVPFRKGDRRLAVHVEDHPVSYIDFEGTIPKGQYGGGTVMVWDRGTYEPLSETAEKDLAGGKLHFVLKGEKLAGEWYLVRLRGGDEWLLIKGGENMKAVSAKADDTSVLSGKAMDQLSQGEGRVWQSNRSEKTSFKTRMADLAKAVEARDEKTAGRKRSPKKTTSVLAGKTVAKKPGSPKKTAARKTTNAKATAKAKSGAGAPTRRESLKNMDTRTGSHGGTPHQTPAVPVAHDNDPGKISPVATDLRAVRAGRPKARGESIETRSLPDFIEPMKAQLVDDPPRGKWIYEIKFDGFRAIAFRDTNGTRLLSRNNKDFAGKFPDVVEAIAALKLDDAIIDGEIVVLDDQGRSSFQLLQAYDLGQQRPPIVFYAFDLLQLNGRNLQTLPLVKRKAKLERLLKNGPATIRYSMSLGNEPQALLKQAKQLGLEGLIGKRPESGYEPGQRSGNWIKLKLHQVQEFVVGGYTPPGGTRQHFGALLVGVYEGDAFKFAGKVGTGFNTKLLRSLHDRFKGIARDTCPFSDLPEKRTGRYGQGITAAEMKRCHWVEPELVCQLKYTEWTRDHRLRHPVFLGLREDKSAHEVVREG